MRIILICSSQPCGSPATLQLIDRVTCAAADALRSNIFIVDLAVQVTKGECLCGLVKEEVKAGAVAPQEGSLGVVHVRHFRVQEVRE